GLAGAGIGLDNADAIERQLQWIAQRVHDALPCLTGTPSNRGRIRTAIRYQSSSESALVISMPRHAIRTAASSKSVLATKPLSSSAFAAALRRCSANSPA